MIEKIASKRIYAYTESKLHPRAASSIARQPMLIFQQNKNILEKIKRQPSQFSRSVVSDSLQPHGLQHNKPPCQSPNPKVYSTHVHWVTDAFQTSNPLSCLSPLDLNLSEHQGLFKWVSSSHQVAKVLESFQWIFRTDFLEDRLAGSPCSSRDSQESSPTLQFKSINSLVLSFLYSLTLTSIYDYWKKHSFD